MQPSLQTPTLQKTGWNYVSVTVEDNGRSVTPSQVDFDQIVFHEPPCLTGGRVEILVVNGDVCDRLVAEVLPHERSATRIPIRLVTKGCDQPATK